MPDPSNSNYFLILLWFLHAGLVLFLACLNPNHYTTIDSQYYLESAQNILKGNGYTILQENHYRWNGTFPAGYSITIAIVSFITKTDVLWASKIVNIGASGIWLFLLNRWFGKSKALWIGCILLSGSFLKLWAHSWSEPQFLIILFCWVYQLSSSSDLSWKRIFYLLLLGISLMLTRYAGIFIVPLTFCYSIFWLTKNESAKAFVFGLTALVWSVSFALYLRLNFNQSGEIYGGERFNGKIYLFENVIVFAKGLVNEVSLIINTDFKSFDPIFLIGFIFQIFILLSVIKESNQKITNLNFVKHIGFTAFSYLISLFIIRIFSHFDEPGYRLLSPCTFLILCSLLLAVSDQKLTVRIKILLIVIVVFSLLDIVPKSGLKDKLNKSLERLEIPVH